MPGQTPHAVEAVTEQLRPLRFNSTLIAAELGFASSTVCAELARLGLNRLSRLEPAEPSDRHCCRHPRELVLRVCAVPLARCSRAKAGGIRSSVAPGAAATYDDELTASGLEESARARAPVESPIEAGASASSARIVDHRCHAHMRLTRVNRIRPFAKWKSMLVLHDWPSTTLDSTRRIVSTWSLLSFTNQFTL